MKKFLVAAALAAVPMAAPAATYNISLDGLTEFYMSETLEKIGGSDVDTYNFTASSPVKISGIAIVGVGSNSGMDLDATAITINGASYAYGEQTTKGALAYGNVTAPDIPTTTAFSIILDASLAAKSTSYALAFDVAPVPVPAAGGMLGLALVGGAAVAMRKRKSETA
ncbi:hypothetical protein [Mangrovicoccus algicola]|uniref:VPLPA-CTERM sorting domain-containing protein n=1 Tax=Mangrovicoccus algicola TaxID=2771008 RepID=A0A8J6Z5F7_9RHOB|nr:hypothetical protein [Mangrovicoccus algicola]MBE3636635.1 hypothetical protein [Mangrovicoccus algicola]